MGHPMSWEPSYHHIIHPSDIFIDTMFRNQALTGLTKHRHKKINQVPHTINYTENITAFYKGRNIDTTNLQPGEFIHMYFSLYNMTCI